MDQQNSVFGYSSNSSSRSFVSVTFCFQNVISNMFDHPLSGSEKEKLLLGHSLDKLCVFFMVPLFSLTSWTSKFMQISWTWKQKLAQFYYQFKSCSKALKTLISNSSEKKWKNRIKNWLKVSVAASRKLSRQIGGHEEYKVHATSRWMEGTQQFGPQKR